jgi:DNA-binding NarL/FixJ family response regulator
MEVTAAAGIDNDVLEKTEGSVPDVFIVDVDGSDIGDARKLKQRLPQIGLILLSSNESDNDFFEALRMQASAYLRKELTPKELNDTVRAVAQGESPIQVAFTTRQKVAVQVLHKFQEFSSRDNKSDISPLTARETEVLSHIARGLLNKQIATDLGVTEQTIKNHVTSILRKLNANARTEAVVLAIKRGLITIT